MDINELFDKLAELEKKRVKALEKAFSEYRVIDFYDVGELFAIVIDGDVLYVGDINKILRKADMEIYKIYVEPYGKHKLKDRIMYLLGLKRPTTTMWVMIKGIKYSLKSVHYGERIKLYRKWASWWEE